jgi:hypothetical protein
MERIGDGEDFGYDDLPTSDRFPMLTAEGLAFTAAGLVLSSLFVGSLFQFLGLVVLDQGGQFGGAAQYAVFAGPTGVMAAAGAWLGRQAMRLLELDRVLRGVAAAAFVIGVVIAATTTVGIAVGFAVDQGF